jgi:hypothetical protein
MTKDDFASDANSPDPDKLPNRRKFLGSVAVGAGLAGLAAASAEEKQLSAKLAADKKTKVDAVSAASKKYNWTTLKQRKGRSPMGSVGEVMLSRIIMGGNLIGGWAHARDLIYVSKLVKAYHTREKIFQTFRLGEACGVNTIIINPVMFDTMKDYAKNGGGEEMQFISDCGSGELMTTIKKSIDAGACSCYIQGGIADSMVRNGQFDRIAQAVELIRKAGMPAGIGGHKLNTIKACVDKGIKPDYWMKTLHHTNYWSAGPKQQHDNIWCEKPKETIEYMEKLPEPWIAFKVLAAGAIHPKVGFKYAFENGADFICVGMYDFQVVEDVNLIVDIFKGKDKKLPKRRRKWHG